MLWKAYATESGEHVLAECEAKREGLSLREARARRKHSLAARVTERETGLIELLKRRFRSSFLYLLLAASGLSFLLGDAIEGWLILIFVSINVSLEIFQEFQSEHAARLLKRYLVSYALVRRAGREVRIQSSDIVSGDILLFSVGDRLQADVRILGGRGLLFDESIITGESTAVPKHETPLARPPHELYEAKNIGFAGTVVTAGSGEGVVFAVGKNTAFGDIATLANETNRETTFEKGLNGFSRFILKLVAVTLSAVFVANAIIHGGETSIVELLIFSLALAVSVIPEALPVITTVALSRGSVKLAQKKVIVKRLSAIEDLGSIDILCTDKTGTITENALRVVAVAAHRKEECLHYAFLGALEHPDTRRALHDSFDLALYHEMGPDRRAKALRAKRLESIPFDPEQRCNSALIEERGNRILIARGAPEAIFRKSLPCSPGMRAQYDRFIERQGALGRRVLAVAVRVLEHGKQAPGQEGKGLRFVGLIAFEDPLKKSAAETITHARALGVQVKILTGDSREVAGAVGTAVGLLSDASETITAEELFLMPHEKRRLIAQRSAVIARVSPRQKYEIIRLLEERHAVGFLGEGINDAPALKLANVAIVVQGAADVAREAADVVLLQKSLETVVTGIHEGRIIFSNIRKYLKITLSSNFGNFYSVALSSLFLTFLPLLPIQILLLNLLSDFPMIAIATDTVDEEELDRPRDHSVHGIVLLATVMGAVSSIIDFILFGLYRSSAGELQTAWFLLSVTTEVILIYSLRTRKPFFLARRPSPMLMTLSVFALVAVFLLPYSEIGQTFFRFVRPTEGMLYSIGFLALAYFLMTELVKRQYVAHFLAPTRGQKTALTF